MPFDLNFILVAVELVLLVPTLLLLVLGRREERGRRHLLEQITRTAKIVSRQEYFNSVHSSMQKATRSISGIITGSAPKSREEEEIVKSIVEEIRRANQRGVVVRYLVPESQDRLRVASLYKQAGAEIRFLLGLVVNDLRFEVVDNKSVVIGLPVTAGQNQPTREGYMLPSEGLSEILSNQFENKWKSGRSYDDYIGQVLNEIKSHNPNVSRELLLNQLQIPEGELQRFLPAERPLEQRIQ
ncbi:MAG: hypothetical protein M1368_10265 [Thaumarchaeota archaeon]|nr:hypothetical protein [Nitrososphaerota archaeon]